MAQLTLCNMLGEFEQQLLPLSERVETHQSKLELTRAKCLWSYSVERRDDLGPASSSASEHC